MNKLFVIPLLMLALLSQAYPADRCAQSEIDGESAARCISQETQRAEQAVNDIYLALRDNLKGRDLAQLTQSQANWQSETNSQCGKGALRSASGNPSAGERSQDSSQICQLRELRQRIDALLRIRSLHQAKQAIRFEPDARPNHLHDFVETTLLPRRAGKWYFEVELDGPGILQSQAGIAGDWPIAFWSGCSDMMSGYDVGTLIQFSRDNKRVGRETIALALDLDHNRLYLRRNGAWQNGPPGSSEGKPIRQGVFQCGVAAVIATQPLIQAGLMTINFGQTPFKHPPPGGFAPLQPPLQWILAGEESDRKTLIDYRQFQLNTGAPTLFVKQQFKEPQDSGPALAKHIARIAELEVDCKTEQVKEVALTQLDTFNRPIAFSQRTRAVEHRAGDDNMGGRLVKSVCFLRNSGFQIPDASPQEVWEEMQSPAASVRIFEAPQKRQVRNGLLLIKQKNETTATVNIFGKESSNLIAISALDCNTMNAVQLASVRYDAANNPLGIDFFMPPSTIRLEKNRARFQEACRQTGK